MSDPNPQITPPQTTPSQSSPRRLPWGVIAKGAVLAAGVALGTAVACSERAKQQGIDTTRTAIDPGTVKPDSYPVMLNKDMPFRYPPALYAEKVQGNVMLRLFVERDGSVADDSTRVIESSKVPALDSAALKGAHELKFEPARLRGVPMPVTILFPVYFRHPEAPPPASDSLLKRVAPPAADSAHGKGTSGKDTTGKKSSTKSSSSGSSTHRRRHRSD